MKQVSLYATTAATNASQGKVSRADLRCAFHHVGNLGRRRRPGWRLWSATRHGEAAVDIVVGLIVAGPHPLAVSRNGAKRIHPHATVDITPRCRIIAPEGRWPWPVAVIKMGTSPAVRRRVSVPATVDLRPASHGPVCAHVAILAVTFVRARDALPSGVAADDVGASQPPPCAANSWGGVGTTRPP